MSNRKGSRYGTQRGRTVAYISTALIGIFCLAPLFWILSTSLKPMGSEYLLPVKLWPSEPSLQAYQQVLGPLGFPINLKNSFIVSIVTAVLSLAVASLSAYAVARLRFKYQVQSLIILQMGAMIPIVVTIAPTFMIVRELGLLRTLPAMIIANTFYNTPMATWLLASYFSELPFELDDAAKVDGYRPLQIFWKVILPLAAPGLFSAGVFGFLGSWGEFMLASAVTMGVSEVMTVPVAILNFSLEFRYQWTWVSAGIILSLLPVILMVVIFQRWVIQGLTAGAVKH
jgi:ABC-type glycerol-3-phosphate transport system permease component